MIAAFIAEWLVAGANTGDGIQDNEWNGPRLFQAAKFGTEMQYQHLVFEEFARTIQPNVDAFLDFNDTIDASIMAEFAHTVYRFGHSMLTETIDRLDPNFQSSEIGLIAAFLNPLEFAASGVTPEAAAAAIIRGVQRQVGNEIDEFVTEALRNNLVGLAARSARDQHCARPRRRDSVLERGAPPILRRHRRQSVEAVHKLGRFRPAPEAPGLADQFHRRLWHPLDHHCGGHPR